MRPLALVALLVLGVAASSPAAAPRRATWQVLGAARSTPTFFRPAGVAVSASGTVYVADAGNVRVVHLSPNGRVLGRWRRSGHTPTAIAVGRNGTVYVAEPAVPRIEVLSARGKLLSIWRPPLSATALAVDARGHLLVTASDELAALAPPGLVLTRTRIVEAGHGGVTLVSVAVARDAIYVSGWWPDSSHPLFQQRWFVQKLSADLKPLESWPDVGGMLATYGGRVYVGNGASVQVLDDGGRTVAQLGMRSVANVSALAVDGRGNLYAADDVANQVVELAPAGRVRVLRHWGAGGTTPGRFAAPWDVAASANGDLYVDDVRAPGANVQRLSPTGAVRAAWRAGVDHGLGVDARGHAYVLAYPGHSVVRAYGQTGRLLDEWPLPDAASRVTADRAGDVFVLADCSGLCVEELHDGNLLARWTVPPDARVVADGPFTVDGRGSAAYVTTLLPSLRYGVARLKLAREDSTAHVAPLGTGSWRNVTGLAVDAGGNVYLSDPAVDRILELSPTGRQLGSWGATGNAAGRFHTPAGVAVGPHGAVYVADSGNSRLQKLTRR